MGLIQLATRIADYWRELPIVGQLLVVLVGMMTLDIITALIGAKLEGRVSSKIGWKGASKKALTLFGVVTAALLSLVIDSLPVNEEIPAELAVSTVIGWYIVMEFLSVNENFTRAGMTIPIISPLARQFAKLLSNIGAVHR